MDENTRDTHSTTPTETASLIAGLRRANTICNTDLLKADTAWRTYADKERKFIKAYKRRHIGSLVSLKSDCEEALSHAQELSKDLPMNQKTYLESGVFGTHVPESIGNLEGLKEACSEATVTEGET